MSDDKCIAEDRTKEILVKIDTLQRDFNAYKLDRAEKDTKVMVEIANLKGKSKLWGSVGGALMTFTMSVFGLVIWLAKAK